MNIKSLLIGSAAALVAVSGARAADAVVAEPEAVEYVRVCDAYGAGFFYIPGTETCLKIGGYVRYQIDYADGDSGWRKRATANLNFTASSDTEMGTLTSYIEFTMGQVPVYPEIVVGGVVTPLTSGPFSWGTSLSLNQAWIALGGLKMGWNGDGAFDGGLDGEGTSGGGTGANFISYTFSGGNGFSATATLEEVDDNWDYVPNFVGKVSYSAGTVGVDAWAAYDSTADEFALKGRVSVAVGDAGSFKVLANYNSGASIYNNGSNWSLGASYSHKLNDKLALTGAVQYLDGPNTWKLGAVADYTIVPGFAAKLAITHDTAAKATGGFLRFQRSF